MTNSLIKFVKRNIPRIVRCDFGPDKDNEVWTTGRYEGGILIIERMFTVFRPNQEHQSETRYKPDTNNFEGDA